MKTRWIIEDGPFEDQIESFISKLEELEYEYFVAKYIPFESEFDLPDWQAEDGPIISLSSINMAKRLQRSCTYEPGPIVTWDCYSMNWVLAYYAEHMYNDDLIICPYYQTWKYSGDFFIRPIGGDKKFAGQVVNFSDRKGDRIYLDSILSPHDLVCISDNYPPEEEYRLVIVDGKIIAGSKYREAGNLDVVTGPVPHDIVYEAQAILDQVGKYPDHAFVMDVAAAMDTIEHSTPLETFYRVRILEFNAFCTSGLYAAEPEPIIRAIDRMCVREWLELYDNGY